MERLESRTVLTALPFGAMPDDTGEFLLGDVLVTLVLMESSTSTSVLNNNSENWTTPAIEAVKAKVEEGLQWWEDTLAGITAHHQLDFLFDYTHADNPVLTDYEPITRPSTDFQFWMYDFLNLVGINNSGNFSHDIRRFNHSQREVHDTDWAFTVFVVNDENDADGFFAPGGFDKAFAFSGGRFFVSPAGRPASTFAHEAGHMFWARDEYPGGGTYNTRRGYYNTINENAWDNPAPGFVQADSIMDTGNCEDGGGHLCNAWLNHTSSASSLEMIGWRDTDGDGVFDLADVPHTLEGTGFFEPAASQYRFLGHSSVATLPNINSSGLQNDITLNNISRAQYRIDGGPWQTAAVYEAFAADLDLTIPMPAGSSQIEIRTIDDLTGITSPVFQGNVQRPTSTRHPGISGFVWDDANSNGLWDSGEAPVEGQTVQLVDAAGLVLQLARSIEPDDFTSNTMLLNNILPEVTLTAIGAQVSDDSVTSIAGEPAADGNRVFASFSANCGGFCRQWTTNTRRLRIDFSAPVTSVSIEAIGMSIPGHGRLEIYDASDNLLARATTAELGEGEAETMALSRPTAEIAYAVARSHAQTTIQLDNLRFGPQATAVTDALGAYELPYLEPGDYTVEVVVQAGQTVTAPESAARVVTLEAGEAEGEVDFGVTTAASPWQNPNEPFDVNGDTHLSPIDALQIINDLNTLGARPLTDEAVPPYVDANGDRNVSPLDVLFVINELNLRASAEGERLVASASDGTSPPRAAAAGRLATAGPGVAALAEDAEVAEGEDTARPAPEQPFIVPPPPVPREAAGFVSLGALSNSDSDLPGTKELQDDLLTALAADVTAAWWARGL